MSAAITAEGWSWPALRASALVGTARRPVPPVAEVASVGVVLGDGTDPAAALLDAAAVVGAGRRAGRHPGPPHAAAPAAPPDPRPDAPAAAAQLLELLVGPTPPVGTHRAAMVAHWCRAARAAGVRVPDRILPALLDHATGVVAVRDEVRATTGSRAAWLAGLNPTWAWAVTAALASDDGTRSARLDADDWARRPSAERIAVLAEVRASDPDAARDLVAGTWGSDPASARRAHLTVLAEGIGPADADLLEAALDDRAASVRAEAQALLDALPTSARAVRLGNRLAPLLARSDEGGDPTIAVALPDDPDSAGGRDGLGPPLSGRSTRGWWIEQLAAGAPLDVWTSVSGADEDETLAMIDDADARAGIARAAAARHDAAWASALLRAEPDPKRLDAKLVDAVPLADRAALVTELLERPTRPPAHVVAALLDRVDGEWSASFSALVVTVLREDPHPLLALRESGDVLASRLHPDAAPLLASWHTELGEQPQVAGALRSVITLQSLVRSITEAFA